MRARETIRLGLTLALALALPLAGTALAQPVDARAPALPDHLPGTLGEIDKPAEELRALDKYDAAYLPKRIAQRVWPLMKLRRYDDSRAAAKAAVASGTDNQRMIARSDLCAAECEAGDRLRAFQACTDALADFRAPGTGGSVEY